MQRSTIDATRIRMLDTLGTPVLACTNQDGDPSAKRIPASQVTYPSLARLLGDRRRVRRLRVRSGVLRRHNAPGRSTLADLYLLASHPSALLSTGQVGPSHHRGKITLSIETAISSGRHAKLAEYVVSEAVAS